MRGSALPARLARLLPDALLLRLPDGRALDAAVKLALETAVAPCFATRVPWNNSCLRVVRVGNSCTSAGGENAGGGELTLGPPPLASQQE
jgi:hypothetical protein